MLKETLVHVSSELIIYKHLKVAIAAELSSKTTI